MEQLERGHAQRGEPPLVLTSDGGECDCAEVRAWLHEHRVVHLRNVPRTPRHDPWVERAFRDL